MVFVLIFAFLEALTYDHHKEYNGWAYVYQTDIDVLIMGSSQADASFDAKYISEETGKNVVILSSGAQSAKQLYFNLIEVLKYQKPELIMVEEFSIIEDTLSWMDENGLYGLALLNLDGMKMSPLKLRAAFSAVGFDGYGVFHIMREAGKTERFLFALKHLKLQIKRIFKPEEKWLSPYKGTIYHTPETLATEEEYLESVSRTPEEGFELPRENVRYMDKIIALCKKNGIEVELVKTPLIKNASSLSGHEAIVGHLKETNSDVKAFNLMDEESGLTFQFEDFTDVNHVSASECLKCPTGS